MMKYLALGDSYTIGEAVPYHLNFPSQLIEICKQHGFEISLDKLIAVTGFTTDELMNAIEKDKPSFDYDLVTLLIGVNNQYRGRTVEEYRGQFYALLCMAILFAKGNTKQVVVVSIPDWGLTPFNVEKDKAQVSKEIDAYNAINREITEQMGCIYVDITPMSRIHANDESYLVNDKLHYSEKAYRLWAESIFEKLKR